MAITCKVSNQFNEEYSKGEHDLVNDSLVAILLDTSYTTFDPTSDSTYSDIYANEIATGNGYTQKTKTLTTVSLDQAAGVITLNADNISWTASGGSIEATKACAIINDTHSNDTVVCCIEFGANYTATDGTTLTLNLSSGLFEVTANPT
jgi:hypothetical protein